MHPNAQHVLRGFQAFAQGDMETLKGLFADNATWHVAGRNKWSGDYSGPDSFDNQPHAVLADDDHVVVLINVSMHRNGRSFSGNEYDALDPCFEMEDGVLQDIDCGEPLLVGHDKGMTHLKKLTWLGSGSVDEAYGPFAEWDGRNTKIKGNFTLYPFGAPETAKGTLRFN